MGGNNNNNNNFSLFVPFNLFSFFSLQLGNGSSYNQRDTAKRGNLVLLRHRRRTCLLNMYARSYEIMGT